MRVFEISILNAVFAPKMGQVTEHRRQIRNEEIQ